MQLFHEILNHLTIIYFRKFSDKMSRRDLKNHFLLKCSLHCRTAKFVSLIIHFIRPEMFWGFHNMFVVPGCVVKSIVFLVSIQNLVWKMILKMLTFYWRLVGHVWCSSVQQTSKGKQRQHCVENIIYSEKKLQGNGANSRAEIQFQRFL